MLATPFGRREAIAQNVEGFALGEIASSTEQMKVDTFAANTRRFDKWFDVLVRPPTTKGAECDW
jgi:hypothetical protein